MLRGVYDDAELELQHVHGFGGHLVLLDALRQARVPVHGHGLGLLDEATGLEIRPGSSVGVLVGAHAINVVVDPPDRDSKGWRIRVPTQVIVRQGEADPGRALRMHDAELARGLRTAGFALAGARTSVEAGTERYSAVWERTATDARDTAAAIKAVSGMDTRVEPEPEDDFWQSMGDLTAMQRLAERLAAVGTADVTPWGLTLRDADGRELAVIDSEGLGTFKVCLVLAEGSGAKAARRRTESVLDWFERKVAGAWRAQGFTTPRRGGVVAVDHDGVQRWAVVIDLSFKADEGVAGRLAWARDHGVLAFPVSGWPGRIDAPKGSSVQ